MKEIVLIDDNQIFRFLFENLLKGYNDEPFNFKSFENALDALDYFNENKDTYCPDIIYVDINMPFMTGWEMMEKLTTADFKYLQKSKIYIISSSDNPNDIDFMKNFPFVNEYLLKPINQEKLIASIIN